MNSFIKWARNLVILLAVGFLLFILALDIRSVEDFKFTVKDRLLSAPVPSSALVYNPSKQAPNFTPDENPYKNQPYELQTGLSAIAISSVNDLISEVNKANQTSRGQHHFILEDGIYTLGRTLQITNDDMVFSSLSGRPETVIIEGSAHKNSGIESLFRVTGDRFVVDGITLRNVSNHLIQIAGESDADYPVIRNCILQDAFEQLLKVSYDADNRPENSSDFGLVENCTFQYTDGIGPNFYIGGIDIHAGNSWIIRNNTFKDIASPSRYIAEHAIHVWNNAYNTLVEGNTFEDNDRAVGFGMVLNKRRDSITYSHRGGIIRGNVIYHSNNGDPFADTGIILEDSAQTLVENNQIWFEHDYPYAIEYRYPGTQEVVIRGNTTNRKIRSRDGAKAEVYDNNTRAKLDDILIQ